MLVWIFDELEKCRHHVFPELLNSSLSYIYGLVGECQGPVWRHLLKCYVLGRTRKRLTRELYLNFKDPLDFIRTQEQSLSAKVSGRLLHKVPDSELYQDGWHRVWASAYVIDRFVNMIDAHAASNMNRQVMEGLARNERDGTLGKVRAPPILQGRWG
jgi:hypothetical protein